MKKYFDKILLFTWYFQVLIVILVAMIICLIVAPIAKSNLSQQKLNSNFYTYWLWGVLHFCDGGFIGNTIQAIGDEIKPDMAMNQPDEEKILSDMTKIQAENGEDASRKHNFLVFISFLVWISGVVSLCFVTGIIINAFENRRNRIAHGEIRYRFSGHGVILGWNFQGISAAHALFDYHNVNEILILTEQNIEDIQRELKQEFPPKKLRHVYFYNSMNYDTLFTASLPQSKAIIILGDTSSGEDPFLNEAYKFNVVNVLRKASRREDNTKQDKNCKRKTIPIFVNINSTLMYIHFLFANQRIMEDTSSCRLIFSTQPHIKDTLPSQNSLCKIIYSNHEFNSLDLALSSFSSIIQFNKGLNQGNYECDYAPLLFHRRSVDDYAHLFIIGFGEMCKAIVYKALFLLLPNLNPQIQHVITIFAKPEDKSECEEFLRQFWTNGKWMFYGIKINRIYSDISASENESFIVNVSRDVQANLTIFITGKDPKQIQEKFFCLPRVLAFENVRVLLELRMRTNSLPMNLLAARSRFYRLDFIGLTDRTFVQDISYTEDVVTELSTKIPYETDWFGESMRLFIQSILEKIYYAGYELDLCDNDEDNDMSIDEETIETLARMEHLRRANQKMVAGFVPCEKTDDFYCESKELLPWDKQSKEYQKNCKNIITTLFSKDIWKKISNHLYRHETGGIKAGQGNTSKFGYRLRKSSFRTIIGHVNCHISKEKFDGSVFSSKDELGCFYATMLHEFRLLSTSSKRSFCDLQKDVPPNAHWKSLIKLLGEENLRKIQSDRYPSLAALCTMEDGTDELIFALCLWCRIPVIAILSEEPTKIASRMAYDARQRFEQKMRCVYRYFVVPGCTPENKYRQMEIFIARCSDWLYFYNCEKTKEYARKLIENSQIITPSELPDFLKIRENYFCGEIVCPKGRGMPKLNCLFDRETHWQENV